MIRPPVRWLRRAAVIALALGGGLLVYRLVGIYRFRPSLCPAMGPRADLFPGGEAAAAVARSRDVRVVSYNLGGHRALLDDGFIADAARLLRALAPDLVGIQEVHQGTLQARFAGQAEELARRTGLTAVFGASLAGYRGTFGNALLVRGEVLETRVLALPTFGEPRTLLACRVRLAREERETMVYVTHLTTWGPLNRAVRRRQIACIVGHLARTTGPFLLVGDLNASPAAPEVAGLLASGLLRGGSQEVTHARTGRRLDYVLAGAGWEVVAERVIRSGPSDHWPVLTRLSPREEG